MAGKGGIRSTSFKKGQSGNPGGRPKQLGDVRDLARAYTAQAIANLIKIAGDSKAPHAARVAANNSILDRGWGKPAQEINANIRRDILSYTDEELAAFVSEGESEAGTGISGEGESVARRVH